MPLRVGIDLVQIAEVRDAVATHGERYLERVYTDGEVRDCRRKEALVPSRLAARFAAKEAAMKVLRDGDEALPWRSISIVKEPAGRPRLVLTGDAAELARSAGLDEVDVSLTHEGEYAAAAVIASSRREPTAR
jgi:holo-[acyl-carrier protein] synthase